MAVYRGRRPPRPEPGPDINGRLLKHKELRVIGSDGSQLGVMTSRSALDTAQSEGLDLVLVAPGAVPPVARITDFGKHKYLESKLGKDKKKKQKQEVKGIKISPRIAEHDLGFLVKNATKFLDQGNKVRVVCMFKARELAHPDNGKARLQRFAELLAEIAVVDKEPNLEGRQMIMILSPNDKVKKKDAKNQDEQVGSEEV